MQVPGPVPAESAQWAQFVEVTGALSQLVVLSLFLERGLAFLFEHDWFRRYFCIKHPAQPELAKPERYESKYPGLKGLIALLVSQFVCHFYGFDVLAALFRKDPGPVGMTMTGVVAAGGSAGAIAILQGTLGFNRESRERLVTARQLEAQAQIELAQATITTAQARATIASARALPAQATIAQAKAEAAIASASPQTAPAQAVGSEGVKP